MDRDLVADVEKLLSAQPSDYQTAYMWLRRNKSALIAALEAAQRPPLGPTEGTLRFVDRAIWVDHGDGNMDGLTGELPIWADEWGRRIVDAVNDQSALRPPLGYIVVTRVEGRGPFVHGDHRRVMGSEAEAIASVGRGRLPRGMRRVVVEAREVPDRG